MPEADFNRVHEEEFCTFDLSQQLPDQPFDFFVQCEMKYPEHLHSRHNEKHFSLEKFPIDSNLLSESQLALSRKYAMP